MLFCASILCFRRSSQKAGKGTGYSGVENALFYAENAHLLYGSAQQAVNEVIKNIKTMG